MELKDLKIGMPVRYENQKWKGIVKDIRAATNEAVVVFEGDGMDELIHIGYLRPFINRV
jgi:hypothetical protein